MSRRGKKKSGVGAGNTGTAAPVATPGPSKDEFEAVKIKIINRTERINKTMKKMLGDNAPPYIDTTIKTMCEMPLASVTAEMYAGMVELAQECKETLRTVKKQYQEEKLRRELFQLYTQ